jgi:hypothetical protein
MRIESKVYDAGTLINRTTETDGSYSVEFYPNARAKVPGWDGDVPVRLVKVEYVKTEQRLELTWNIDLAGIAAMDDPPTRTGECPDCGGRVWQAWYPTDGYRYETKHEPGCVNV